MSPRLIIPFYVLIIEHPKYLAHGCPARDYMLQFSIAPIRESWVKFWLMGWEQSAACNFQVKSLIMENAWALLSFHICT